MKGFIIGLVGVVGLSAMYGLYLAYAEGAISLPLFLLGCVAMWVLVVLGDRTAHFHPNGSLLFRGGFWGVTLLIWYVALFYINVNFEGYWNFGLLIAHFFALVATPTIKDAIDFRMTREQHKKEIRQSTDVEALRSRFIDPDYIAPELKKVAQKRIDQL